MNRDRIDALLAATWPPVATQALGPWTLRDGGGGGKRVSAASTRDAVTEYDISSAERAMDDAGQQALFAVFADQDDLDQRLSDRTYLTLDPTILYTGGVDSHTSVIQESYASHTQDSPPEDALRIWKSGGIGPARIAIMDRVTVPKTTLLLTRDGTPVATAFAAIHDGTAMLHALEVLKPHRRQGAGKACVFAATRWAKDNGARDLALLVTRANTPANALYQGLGLSGRPCYHYRIRP